MNLHLLDQNVAQLQNSPKFQFQFQHPVAHGQFKFQKLKGRKVILKLWILLNPVSKSWNLPASMNCYAIQLHLFVASAHDMFAITYRTWRKQVHLLWGAPVAQRLFQLQEVLRVSGGQRFPHRERWHPVSRVWQRHVKACKKQFKHAWHLKCSNQSMKQCEQWIHLDTPWKHSKCCCSKDYNSVCIARGRFSLFQLALTWRLRKELVLKIKL